MDASLKDYLSGLPTGKGSVRYGGRVGWLGRTVWGGCKWAGICRGLCLLVYRQVQKRVGSVTLRSFPLGRLPGAPALGDGKSASTRSIRGGGRLFPLLEKFLRPLGFIRAPKNPFLPLAWPAPKMSFWKGNKTEGTK